MKKKLWIPIAVILLLAVFVVPVPTGRHSDDGTREYTSLTYKIVKRNRSTGDGETVQAQTKVYFFPDNFKSIDDLSDTEEEGTEYSFTAMILEMTDSGVLVQPVAGSDVLSSSDRIFFGTQNLEAIGAEVGSAVQVAYTGEIMESYPAQIRALSWKLAGDLRKVEYTGQWMDKSAAEKDEDSIFDHLRIVGIYSNCFFARPVIPMPYVIKLNGTLSDEWCIGDQVTCTYENAYYDRKTDRMEADMLTVQASDWQADPSVAYKPVIYLYPETKTEVAVRLTPDGGLTCTYPAYNDGWNVTALPDGTLIDAGGQTYQYLYWEGETYAQYDFSRGFCVRGKDTAAFLEDALDRLGLTRREANEFIVYWLPLMERNPYNVISFQTDAYTDAAQLAVDPAPDTLIRVFMAWKAADEFVTLPEQELSAPERNGFTVVEWGGTEIK